MQVHKKATPSKNLNSILIYSSEHLEIIGNKVQLTITKQQQVI